MFDDEALLPISALQHYLFCPRQCALIHIERIWAENLFTAEGRVLHAHVHSHESESRPGVRIERSLEIRSLALGIAGQTDVVEFHQDGSILLVEYKRGRPKKNDCDRVQLCAQAMCLEEMLGKQISHGALFYGKNRHRLNVEFDASLRQLTVSTAARLHELIETGTTPPARYDTMKCPYCSLLDSCLPGISGRQVSVEQYFKRMMQD